MATREQRPGPFTVFTVIAFGAFALWLGTSIDVLTPGSSPSWGVVALFAALMVASENLALKTPSRVTISPQIIVVTAGVVALHDHGVVVGSLIIGAAGGLVVRAVRSRRWTLIAFNLGQFALSAGVTAVVFDALMAAGTPAVFAYPLTAATHAVVNFSLVLPAASLRSGDSLKAIWLNMRVSAFNDLCFGVLGLLLGSLYRHVGPVALVAIVVPSVAARTVFAAVDRSRKAYRHLELLYRFIRHIERTSDEPDAVVILLDEFRVLLDVAVAELTVRVPTGWRRTTLGPGNQSAAVTELDDASHLVDVAAAGPINVSDLGDEDSARIELTTAGRDASLITPLLVDGDPIGVITVSDPTDDRRFDGEDLKLLETLGSHAAASLERSRLLEQVRFDAGHDSLTGLANRHRFNQLLARLKAPAAVLIVNLDGFKDINDTLGHRYGDFVLRSVAERVSEELGQGRTVARLGGDEFGVLLPQTISGDAAQVAVALLATLERPFPVDTLNLEVTASIGVAATSVDQPDSTNLVQHADVAMSAAKTARTGWEVYTPERDHFSPRLLVLAGELRHAIDAGELEVCYQPKAALDTGEVVGLEALVRWRHSQFGMLGPDVFIPLAERVGLIRPLTIKVLQAAVLQQRRLADAGYDINVSVNVSVRSVLDVNLPEQVDEVLVEQGVAASRLTLEITEGSVMADPVRTIGILSRLAARGVTISLDDFGTGFSSLTYLKRLPVNEVKIDKSFVSGLLTDRSDAAIVSSTIDLARNLGLRAVAEGVEDGATWQRLAELGCDEGQGFFVSAPLDAIALERWMDRTQAMIDPRG